MECYITYVTIEFETLDGDLLDKVKQTVCPKSYLTDFDDEFDTGDIVKAAKDLKLLSHFNNSEETVKYNRLCFHIEEKDFDIKYDIEIGLK